MIYKCGTLVGPQISKWRRTEQQKDSYQNGAWNPADEKRWCGILHNGFVLV